jgi:hypothetical protein
VAGAERQKGLYVVDMFYGAIKFNDVYKTQ